MSANTDVTGTDEGVNPSATVELMGCRFDTVDLPGAVERTLSWGGQDRRRSHTIVTVNVAILMMMRQDPQLTAAVRAADMVVADGVPLVWVSRWLGEPLPHRVTGVDLMLELLRVGAERGLRVFLLGTTQERLDELVWVIGDRYPGLRIVGSRNGYFGPEHHDDVAAQIRSARADLLLMGMPAPMKEIWAERLREELHTPAILGVGGAFDVLAGYVRRAPEPVQRMGMEWAWRLMLEPRKLWKRYLVTNVTFLALVARGVLLRRLGR
ncbi:WecB/TagA/CpsF family glycosyltransferase [Pseudonocardia xishanensis]|uniref:WecB/TagA/CpsF family glycosyltransferase n=1 Tax=Pseudonocardia xishanensis TaxID=630995 RepID=A0ABP8S221_9PSEU